MNNLKVSIIVPCYKQAQYLDECLQSVLNQTYTNWECIIVNDGSPDNTEEVAKKWIERDGRFKYIFKENGGLSSARNAGTEMAEGTFVLPLDADDYISANYLHECLSVISKDSEIRVVYGKAFKFGIENIEWRLSSYSFAKLLEFNMIFCTALYRKDDWRKVGGYDVNLKLGLEDWEFWINILKNGGRAVQNENCCFFYRVKQISMIKKLSNERDKKKLILEYIFNKHSDAYTNLSHFELYLKGKQLEKKFNNLEKYLSLSTILKLVYKRIKYIIIK